MAALREALSLGRTLPPLRGGARTLLGLADGPFRQRVLADAGFVGVSFDELAEPIRLGGLDR